MTSPRKAPDGQGWPLPFVGVDTNEQHPWGMGFVPAPWREGAPVHMGEVPDPGQCLVTQLLDGPWPTARCSMETGDYQLLDGHGKPLPADRAPCIERKAAGDLVGSLTAGHDRFIDGEMPRLAAFRVPVVVVEAPVEWLLGGRSVPLATLFSFAEFMGGIVHEWAPTDADRKWAHEEMGKVADLLSGLRYEREAHRSGHKVKAMLGSLLSIFTDHRVLPLLLPDRRWAEYTAAWILRRGWRRWLTEEWDAGRRESIEAVRAQRAKWETPYQGVVRVERAA